MSKEIHFCLIFHIRRQLEPLVLVGECVCARVRVCITHTHIHTRTPNTQHHYLLLRCQKPSGRSKWLNVFDGTLHFLNLPHRPVRLERVFPWKDLHVLESISRDGYISRGGWGAAWKLYASSVWAGAAPHLPLILHSQLWLENQV